MFSPKAHSFWRWHWLSQWPGGRKGSEFGTLQNWNTNCISTEKGCWTFLASGQPRASLFCAYSILSDAVWYGIAAILPIFLMNLCLQTANNPESFRIVGYADILEEEISYIWLCLLFWKSFVSVVWAPIILGVAP